MTRTLLVAAAFTAASSFGAIMADAQTAPQTTAVSASQTFVKKRHSIKGGWDIITENGQTQIRFNDDFKTKSGPDLKVYLSKAPLAALDSKTAARDAVKISVLKSNKGQQSYIVPADINLSEYKSVIIHCEAFSVLWGGFDIAQDAATP